MIPLRVLLSCGASVLLAGCATSKVQIRKQERLSAYAKFPEEQQSLIDAGRIGPGMSTNAVYIAWGNATKVEASPIRGAFTWIYNCRYAAALRGWEGRQDYGSAVIYSTLEFVTDYAPRTYRCAEVYFEGNVVKDWRVFPQPID